MKTEIVLTDGARIVAGPLQTSSGRLLRKAANALDAGKGAYQQGGIPDAIRAAYAEWMSPLPPLSPTVPQGTPLRVQDFPVGYNISWIPRTYEGISFQQLRNMADSDYVTRLCIETVKDQISKLTWRIGRKPKNEEPRMKARIADSKDPTVSRLTEFFRSPDGIHNFSTWLRIWIEDMLVGDCATVLIGRADGGKGAVAKLVPAEGGLVHVCIDKQGMRPAPPMPAYQLIAKGQIVGNLTTKELLYMPRNLRAHRVYGMSPVEQLLFFMNIVIRRDLSKLAYYTEGNVPDGLISAPQAWSLDQVKQFNEWMDSILSGQLAQRRKLQMIPSLAEPGKSSNIRDAVLFTKEAMLQDEFDEWRARVTCFCFSLPPTAFVKMMNRASAQQQQKQALEEGIEPRKVWVKEQIDFMIQSPDVLNQPEYEFAWEDDPEIDPQVQANVDKVNVSVGLRSIDELRQRDGLEPFGIGPMIITAQGPILLDDIKSGEGRFLPSAPPQAPVGPDGKPVMPMMAGGPPNGRPNGKQPQRRLNKAAVAESKKKIQIASDPDELPEKSKRRAKVAARSLHRFLTKQGAAIARKASHAYQDATEYVGKDAADDNEKRIEEILHDLDLDWVQVAGLMEQPIRDTMREAATEILLELNISDEASELFGTVNQDALEYAEERSAELVGKTRVNGELTDNPNAKWAITDTTRTELRQLIVKAFDDEMTPAQLERAIEDSFQFSDARATMIARTELSMAHTQGALDAAKVSGLLTHKYVLLSADHDQDDECDDCADAGKIEVQKDFPAGAAPPFHPQCACVLVLSTEGA